MNKVVSELAACGLGAPGEFPPVSLELSASECIIACVNYIFSLTL